MKMKNSILQGALLFAAGVGCAVVAQIAWTPPPASEEELEKHLNDLLVDVSHFGAYVTFAGKGSVVFNLDPARCPTPIPQPKLPANAVDPVGLQQGVAALLAAQEAYMQGVPNPMRNDDKCQVVPEGSAAAAHK